MRYVEVGLSRTRDGPISELTDGPTSFPTIEEFLDSTGKLDQLLLRSGTTRWGRKGRHLVLKMLTQVIQHS